MGLSGEDQRWIYEEDRVREEGREEIQWESRQRQVSLGFLGIIGLVLAVGLPAILIGCDGEATPQTTAETTPVPEINLLDAAQARLRGMGQRRSGLNVLEFVTLRERFLEGGGVGAEILVDLSSPAALVKLSRYEGNPKRNVKILGEFILWNVWPKKHFTVLVYDNKEAWEARGLCEQAHEGGPAGQVRRDRGWPDLHQGNTARERTPAAEG